MKKLLGIWVLGLLLGTQILAADDVYYCLDDQAIGFSGQEKSYGEVKHYEPKSYSLGYYCSSTNLSNSHLPFLTAPSGNVIAPFPCFCPFLNFPTYLCPETYA